MNRLLSFLILGVVACLADARADTTAEEAGRWRLTLDYQYYDGDFHAVQPYALQGGESSKSNGDIAGDMYGFTLSYDRPGRHLVDGVDFSMLSAELDGSADYAGAFYGETDVTTDLLMLELRGRHNLDDMLDDHLHPYLFLGISHREARSDEAGTITFTQTLVTLPVDRRIDSQTTLLQPGLGTTLDTHLGASTIGLRAEATLQLGIHDIDASEGASVDDGNVAGYHLFLGAYGDLPLTESWGLFGQAGLHYQDWFGNDDELHRYDAVALSIGVTYSF